MVDGRILVALKATVDKNDNSHYEASNIARKAMFEGNHWVFQVLDNSKNYKNVNFYSWQDFGSPESYSHQECQLPLLTWF